MGRLGAARLYSWRVGPLTFHGRSRGGVLHTFVFWALGGNVSRVRWDHRRGAKRGAHLNPRELTIVVFSFQHNQFYALLSSPRHGNFCAREPCGQRLGSRSNLGTTSLYLAESVTPTHDRPILIPSLQRPCQPLSRPAGRIRAHRLPPQSLSSISPSCLGTPSPSVILAPVSQVSQNSLCSTS